MTKRAFKQHITDLAFILKQHDISHVVICPGSRNAPLIQVFERDQAFSCFSIVDERSAGYVALGMCKELQKPVVIVTTSGTSTLNLAPAVAEAHYQNIPLIILTADRPAEWPPQFGNQRINQENIYLQNSKHSYQFPSELSDEKELTAALTIFSEIITRGSSGKKGPVHFNIPLNEPLYELVAPEPSGNFSITKDISADMDPFNFGSEDLKRIAVAIENNKKVLLITGMGRYSQPEMELMSNLTSHYEVNVIAENIANLANDRFISSPELVLASADEKDMKALEPDLVLLIGGQVVSKRTRLFIQRLRDVPLFVSESFPGELISLFAGIEHSDYGRPDVSYPGYWKKLETNAWKHGLSFLQNSPYSNLTAINEILEAIPEGTTVHLGNSGTIRYSQIRPVKSGYTWYSNRGTSGIDGSLSTAAGAAMVSSDLHVVILGDLSFIYDSNALWNREFPGNLKIIVLNDKGGGIFRLLDGPDRMSFFGKFSVAHHPASIGGLAEAFNIKSRVAGSFDELKEGLNQLFSDDTDLQLLEVDTGGCENSSIFKQFFKSIHNQHYAKT